MTRLVDDDEAQSATVARGHETVPTTLEDQPARSGRGGTRRQRCRRVARQIWRRLTVETALGPVDYLVAGSGPPVALLHGLSASARWWLPTLRALAPRYRCHALDFVRFDRWRERGRVALPRANAFVTAWLEALGLEWSHLVAHSMGGYAATALAIERPELVGRLVLIAPAGLLGAPLGLRDAARLLGFAGTIAPRFLPVVAADTARTGAHRWLRSFQELRTAAPLDLGAVRAPTLLLWGTRDPFVSPDEGPSLRRRIPGARLLYLPGAGHVPMYERPDACHDAIARFLAGEEVGAP